MIETLSINRMQPHRW